MREASILHHLPLCIKLYACAADAQRIFFYASAVVAVRSRWYALWVSLQRTSTTSTVPLKRLYVICRGRRTTISVDDPLFSYFLRRVQSRGWDRKCKSEAAAVRNWVQLILDAAEDILPETGISQWVQARMLDEIADPELKNEADKTADLELTRRMAGVLNHREKEEKRRLSAQRHHDALKAAFLEKLGPRPR